MEATTGLLQLVTRWIRARPRLAALLAATLLLPLPAAAYGPQGHEQVGYLADQLIHGHRAEREVARILANLDADAQYRNLQSVAVWADCAKGVDGKTFTYKNDGARYPECAPLDRDKAEFESFVRNNWLQCGEPVRGGEYCHQQYHFADVSNFHQDYQAGYVGASAHDVVHAIGAAVARLQHPQAVLQDGFSFDERESLMLLAHYLGDLHQPLHVEAIYLDAAGHALNPAAIKPENDTAGGNNIREAARSLHQDWDEIPDGLKVGGSDQAAMLKNARAILAAMHDDKPGGSDDPQAWAAAWASDTIASAHAPFDVFGGLRFTQASHGPRYTWKVEISDVTYAGNEAGLKEQELTKAGARLALLLETIWPDEAAAATVSAPAAPVATAAPKEHAVSGYLDSDSRLNISAWMPPPPAPQSAQEAADILAFKASRDEVRNKTPRAQMAAEDDVSAPQQVLARFEPAAGLKLGPEQAPLLIDLLARVERDESHLLKPMKKAVADGGRHRPILDFPDDPTCIAPVDLAGHAKDDATLKDSGSYPSGHALRGMMTALILVEAAPAHADAILARGIEFGESRRICGFHYPTDLIAGRLAAAALYARLKADSAFQADLAAAIAELQRNNR